MLTTRFLRRSVAASSLGLTALLLTCVASAQDQNPSRDEIKVRFAPPKVLSQFDISAGTLQTLSVQPSGNGDCRVGVILAGVEYTMLLTLHEMRSPNFQLLVDGENGTYQVPTPDCVTYRGMLLEEPTTKVVATVVDGGVTAEIHRLDSPTRRAETWVVQPLRAVEPTAGTSAHVVYHAGDNLPLPFQCGNAGGQLPLPVPPAGVDVTLNCEIACEADIEFYQLNASNVTSTQNDITSVLNAVEFIYDRDCDIQYTITTIIVSTTAVYSSSDAGTLLSQFRNRWNSVHTSVQRDVAHLFTGRNINGGTIGIATLGTICNLSSAYGLSQSRFSSNANSRAGLTAHELGHSGSSTHCDSTNDCFIMCSGLGGCNNSVTQFGTQAQNEITSFASSRSCLTVVPVGPNITQLSSNTLTVFDPGVLTISGSGFTGTTSVQIAGQTLNTGFTVANDDTLLLTPPELTMLGSTTVNVTTPLGTSNSFTVTYTQTIPPKLRSQPVVFGGNVHTWELGTRVGFGWFLGVSLSTTAGSTIFTHPLLTNWTLLAAGTSSAPFGYASFSQYVPPGLGQPVLQVGSQVIEAFSAFATATSNIKLVTIIN
ncbi:MAG: M12 family metallo-peptidase [Planctomycetota bacterium]|nr:M12 family metallo-peptidase [Planctomycetota bacterium]